MRRTASKEQGVDIGDMKGLNKLKVVVSPTGEAPWVFAVALEL